MKYIKLCPYCGSNAEVYEYYFGDSRTPDYSMQCLNRDDCGSSFCWYDTPEEAIEAWNMRV